MLANPFVLQWAAIPIAAGACAAPLLLLPPVPPGIAFGITHHILPLSSQVPASPVFFEQDPEGAVELTNHSLPDCPLVSSPSPSPLPPAASPIPLPSPGDACPSSSMLASAVNAPGRLNLEHARVASLIPDQQPRLL